MSLLEQASNKGRKATPVDIDGEEAKHRVLNPSVLVRVLNQVTDANQAPKAARKKWSANRTRLGDCSWVLENILGNVTEPIWANIVGKSLEGMLKTIKNSQPNGDWRISEYEADIKRDADGNERLMFAVLWVDSINEPDLKYNNGQPQVNVEVKTPQIPDEVLKAIANRGNTDGDGDLKDLLKGLISVMAKNAGSDKKSEKPKSAEKKDSVISTSGSDVHLVD